MAHVYLELQLPDLRFQVGLHLLQLLDVIRQLVVSLAHGSPFLFGRPSIMPQDLPPPGVRGGAGYAVPVGDLGGAAAPGLELRHGLHLRLDRQNALLGIGPAAPALAGRELVDPAAERLAARVSHGPYRPGEASPMLEVVIDRAPLLLVGILRLATLPFQEPVAADLVFPPPVAERVAGGVAELRYGVGRAAAEPGERLDGLHSLLCAVHPHGPPGPLFGPGFPPQLRFRAAFVLRRKLQWTAKIKGFVGRCCRVKGRVCRI